MDALPDELWRRILEIGLESYGFSYKDLCCISISSRILHRLSDEDRFWSQLISSDFPSTPSSSSSTSTSSSSAKSLYRFRFERDRDRKIMAHNRAVLRKESQISEHSEQIHQIEARLEEEMRRFRKAVSEISHLRSVRQASVALNVWQPKIVRGRHKEIVEQCAVPVEYRSFTLDLELKLCKQQISVLEKTLKSEKQRRDLAKEELASMKYHPLRDQNRTSSGFKEHNPKTKRLRKSNTLED